MTRSANDPAVIPTSHCEAVLRGMSKRADKEGDWIEVKFQIHPQEVPSALWNADLRSRWQLAFVEIGDDERPKAPEKPKERTRSQWAGIRCNDPAFQEWACPDLNLTEVQTAHWLRQKSVARWMR